MADSEPPTEDRRRALREQAFVLAEIVTPAGKVRVGAIDNASGAGCALLLHTFVEVGDRLSITIELDEKTKLAVDGDVVRRDDIPAEGPWRYRVGVKIDPPSQALQDSAERIREQQATGWLRRRAREDAKS